MNNGIEFVLYVFIQYLMSVFHGPVSFRLNNAKLPGKLAAVNMMIKFFLTTRCLFTLNRLLKDFLPVSLFLISFLM